MSVSLQQVQLKVERESVAMTAETVGYLILAVGEQLLERATRLAPERTFLEASGSITLLETELDDGSAERVLRTLMVSFLSRCSNEHSVLEQCAGSPPIGLQGFVKQISTSLMPLNRAAGRRGLIRFHRRVSREGDRSRAPARKACIHVDRASSVLEPEPIAPLWTTVPPSSEVTEGEGAGQNLTPVWGSMKVAPVAAGRCKDGSLDQRRPDADAPSLSSAPRRMTREQADGDPSIPLERTAEVGRRVASRLDRALPGPHNVEELPIFGAFIPARSDVTQLVSDFGGRAQKSTAHWSSQLQRASGVDMTPTPFHDVSLRSETPPRPAAGQPSPQSRTSRLRQGLRFGILGAVVLVSGALLRSKADPFPASAAALLPVERSAPCEANVTVYAVHGAEVRLRTPERDELAYGPRADFGAVPCDDAQLVVLSNAEMPGQWLSVPLAARALRQAQTRGEALSISAFPR